jgi:hypothetical protein
LRGDVGHQQYRRDHLHRAGADVIAGRRRGD